jgi:hypothetical protein
MRENRAVPNYDVHKRKKINSSEVDMSPPSNKNYYLFISYLGSHL